MYDIFNVKFFRVESPHRHMLFKHLCTYSLSFFPMILKYRLRSSKVQIHLRWLNFYTFSSKKCFFVNSWRRLCSPISRMRWRKYFWTSFILPTSMFCFSYLYVLLPFSFLFPCTHQHPGGA